MLMNNYFLSCTPDPAFIPKAVQPIKYCSINNIYSHKSVSLNFVVPKRRYNKWKQSQGFLF